MLISSNSNFLELFGNIFILLGPKTKNVAWKIRFPLLLFLNRIYESVTVVFSKIIILIDIRFFVSNLCSISVNRTQNDRNIEVFVLNINNLLIKWKDYFHYFCYVSFLFNERPLADRFGITLCSYYSTDPIGRNINTRLSLVQLTRPNNIITQFSLVVDLYSC